MAHVGLPSGAGAQVLGPAADFIHVQDDNHVWTAAKPASGRRTSVAVRESVRWAACAFALWAHSETVSLCRPFASPIETCHN